MPPLQASIMRGIGHSSVAKTTDIAYNSSELFRPIQDRGNGPVIGLYVINSGGVEMAIATV